MYRQLEIEPFGEAEGRRVQPPPHSTIETRSARLQRLLSLTAGKVRPASQYFTPKNAIEASAKAWKGNQ